MPFVTTQDGTEIFYKDWGSGQPIVFHHGWPLSSDDWDAQLMFFVQNGYRVIAHDRRGHGRSTQTPDGHDMDTYAADAAAVTSHLDLRDAVHVGHSHQRRDGADEHRLGDPTGAVLRDVAGDLAASGRAYDHASRRGVRPTRPTIPQGDLITAVAPDRAARDRANASSPESVGITPG